MNTINSETTGERSHKDFLPVDVTLSCRLCTIAHGHTLEQEAGNGGNGRSLYE